MHINTPMYEKAEIYKNILAGKAFLNPMTTYIISLKHNVTLLYLSSNNIELKTNIENLISTLEKFKQHTDDISGINLNSSHKIFEILKLIQKDSATCKPYINLYKLCLGSVLDSDELKIKFSKLSILCNNGSDEELLKLVQEVTRDINSHIMADNLAFEHLKIEVLTRSVSCALSNVVYNTVANNNLSRGNGATFAHAFGDINSNKEIL